MSEVTQGNLADRLVLESGGDGRRRSVDSAGPFSQDDTVENLQRMIGRMRESATALNSATARFRLPLLSNCPTPANNQRPLEGPLRQWTRYAISLNRRCQGSRSGRGGTRVRLQCGVGTVPLSVHSMGLIRQRVEGITENMLALSEQTQQIGRIISTVEER